MSSTSNPSDGSKPSLTDKFASLNPFKKSKDKSKEGGAAGEEEEEGTAPEHAGDEDQGQDLTEDSVAGGGRGTATGDIEERKQFRISHALQRFLVEQGELQESDLTGEPDQDGFPPTGPALQEVLVRQPAIPPAYVNDRTHPLSSYLMSSSHNSYIANSSQLRGKASAHRYTQILNSGMRCVEIDCWDNEDDPEEPKVTHGLTLTGHIPFRAVVEAINAAMDKELAAAKQTGTATPLPIFISVENHCGPAGQVRLASIMKENFGEKLLVEPLDPDGKQPRLEQLEGRICCMVEHYASGETDDSKSAGDQGGVGKDSKKAQAKVKIVPELASLGVYANSIKPSGSDWLKEETKDPSNPLLNIGEGPLLEAIEKGHAHDVVRHNTKALQRVYPAGTRITSKNLLPPPFWGVGSHVVALNAQTFDAAMQLNEACFDGTDGFVLKPAYLRMENGQPPAPRPTGQTKLSMTVAGASNLALPSGRKADEVKPYVTCSLYHPLLLGGETTEEDEKRKPKRKTSVYRGHKLAALHTHDSPPGHSPFWHHPETLTWTYPKDELVFLRILLKSDDAFARNPVFAVAAVRVAALQTGQWVFLRLFNLRGEITKGSLCVKFEVEDL